jgi:ubiquinone/menaquinone biosynthesis C-methylase UbiE
MSPADWQLPPGVTRGLWDYLHDADLARGYDARLAGTPLLELDLRFAAEHFLKPGRLLDLGCGTGRLLLPFAGRGFHTVGVDLSAGMLRVARTKANAAGLGVDLVQANLVQLDMLRDESFDVAACLFSTLGMVMGTVERQRVLAHAYRLLRPGGKLILHVHNRWFALWDPPGRIWLLKDLWRSMTGNASTGDRVMPTHQGIAGLALHHFTRREIEKHLVKAGFRLMEVRPISLRADGVLTRPWWFGGLRAYGYLIEATKPGNRQGVDGRDPFFTPKG